MRKVDTSLIVRLCLPQFAVGLFTTMLNNYLIYFYQPSKASGIPDLIPQGRLVLGVLTIIGMIKAVGHIIDAVTDPLIAAGSDKSRHKDGRCIPLMKKTAIPFGPCALLIFFVPLNRVSGLNAAWIAAFMWGYYFAVLNVLPGAMMADIIQYNTVTTGVNQEGIFGAARSFIVKMGNSLAIMIVPSLIVTGAAAGENVGVLGLKLTAVAGALFCILAIFVLLRYRESEVLAVIAGSEKGGQAQ